MSERLDDYLRDLPAVPAPDMLWPRIQHHLRERRRRRRRLIALASAASLALWVGQVWRVPTPAPAAPDPAAGMVDLRALDHALQAAYDRGAADAEIDALWRARAAALQQTEPEGDFDAPILRL